MDILVSIACYRDPRITATINSLYSGAKFPHRIYTWVYWQGETLHEPLYKGKYHDNVHVEETHYTNAKGPLVARHHIMMTATPRYYFLQIDAHTTFISNWDVDLMTCFYTCGDNPIISFHPADTLDTQQVAYTNFWVPSKDDNRLPIITSKYIDGSIPPKQQRFAVGCFFFSYYSTALEMFKRIHIDKYQMIFHGEEILMSAVLHDMGCRIFPPHKNLCSHAYAKHKIQPYLKDKLNKQWIDQQNQSIENLIVEISCFLNIIG
uniref:Glycosyltransferase n=1 Tax=Megaviridae environmental sample TaxID=1737588 RepID=A0A5J6VJD7_9VIRU|nr:MAG: glycosyltransferase [Megaviridae environmental sample]